MWQQIRRLFTAPTSEVLAGGEEEIHRAGLLHSLVSIHAAFLAALVFISFVTPAPLIALSAVGTLLLADVLVLFLNRRGRVSLAAGLFTAALWLVVALLTVVLDGVYGVAFPAYLVIVVVAGVLLSRRWATIFTVLTVLAALALAWAQENNYLPASLGESTPIFMWLSLSVYALMLSGIARLATRGLYAALAQAHETEQSLADSYRQLEESRDALDAQTDLLERRAAQLGAAAEVSRTVVSLLDMEELLWRAADLLSQNFALYHVGIFQLDESGQWARYRAGAGEAGHLLAEQDFRLAVGGDSMIGWCMAHAQSRIVQDVGQVEEDDVRAWRMQHPLVSQTRSEAALPLIARGRVLGGLSLQSDRPGAFDPDTVTTLETVADQLAFAMDNVRLLVSSQEALEAARRAYGESTRQAWADLLRGRGLWGYRYEGADVTSLGGDLQVEAPADAAEAEVDIPLKIRDKMVGVLNFYKDASRPESEGEVADVPAWTPDETRLLERLVEQMGLALESARLYEDTQRTAARDRLLAQVVGRVRETLDVEAVLRTLAHEVREALDLPEVVVRLRPPAAGGTRFRRADLAGRASIRGNGADHGDADGPQGQVRAGNRNNGG